MNLAAPARNIQVINMMEQLTLTTNKKPKRYTGPTHHNQGMCRRPTVYDTR